MYDDVIVVSQSALQKLGFGRDQISDAARELALDKNNWYYINQPALQGRGYYITVRRHKDGKSERVRIDSVFNLRGRPLGEELRAERKRRRENKEKRNINLGIDVLPEWVVLRVETSLYSKKYGIEDPRANVEVVVRLKMYSMQDGNSTRTYRFREEEPHFFSKGKPLDIQICNIDWVVKVVRDRLAIVGKTQ